MNLATEDSGDSSDVEETDAEVVEEEVEEPSEEEEEVEEDLSSLPHHLQQLASLDENQVNSILNNAANFARLSQDSFFKEYMFRAAQRLSGLDVPEPGQGDSSGSDSPSSSEDFDDMNDYQVLEKFVENLLDRRLAKFENNISPILNDYSQRKIEALKKDYPNFDELLPKVESYRASNPAASKIPIEDILKIVDYSGAGDRAFDKIKKKKTKVGMKPRSNGKPVGKTQISLEDQKKMSTADLIRLAAQEQKINLQEG